MEWRFFFRRKIGGSTTVQERRTAVVQLCDTKMILVIQISAMKRECCIFIQPLSPVQTYLDIRLSQET